jgi:transcriptional regulator with XRE-family HTH domain
MPLGTQLRYAREEAGLSAMEISERTKIPLYKIEALENGDFVHLPDGIYLDGIVQAYARELALEPEPLIERLHRERPPVAQDWVAVLRGIYSSKQRKGRGREHWKPITIDLPKGPVRRASSRGRRQPVIPARRRGGFALPLISLLAAAGWGLYLHEATRLPGNQTLATERPPADANPRVDPVASPAAAAAPTLIESGVTPVSVRDVSGSWMLLTRAERGRYAGSTGVRLGYQLHLEQDGDRVTGSGQKLTENGRAIESPAQTPISIAGTVESDRLTLTFTERGTRRATEGKFVLLLDEDGMLRGRYSSDAAHSAGTVEAYRLQ